MKDFIPVDKIKVQTRLKRDEFCAKEKDWVINYINTKIEAAADKGCSEVTVDLSDSFDYIDLYDFAQTHIQKRLKELGYGVYVNPPEIDESGFRTLKVYINWGIKE